MRKISKEKWNVCPECNMDLGVAPLQKIRSDHQMQGIKDIFPSKRRELIELGLIEKSKKDEPKKLAREDIYLNYSVKMLIDLSPHPPAPVVVATSSRRKEKSISSLVNTTPLVVDDQVSNQDNVESIGYAVESSKNDGISKKNKSIEPLDEMNDLSEPLNKLVTKGDTLDNSKESVPSSSVVLH
ncbi:E3 ubiquitin protein ligase DRIP2-like [Solanum tuberosum]|uniref:E3 ubiquitin protein ligase DRIP2-like n=1 Tax=Solanum tuberosum TaxID=4113 RepID=UPI00073A1298|nr:PREDICTED: E3 ubiquitin protein ligase DRIP2-like [Solanum tuberosum]